MERINVIENPAETSKARTSVLLVEDDAGVRRSLQLLLRGRGYDVRAYATGKQMLADPRSTEAACLIADYRMDEMDGLAVLRGLRAQGWNQPAILITAHHAAELLSAAREAGFDTVLEKPLQDHMLVENVDRTIRAS